MAGQSGDSGQSLRSMTKPPWRCSLIEALTMTCAEIDERRARYEAMSEEERLRGLLSRVEESTSDDPVKADIERTIDHLLHGRTTKDQRKGLTTATERAERVRPGDDAAVGRALR